MKYLALLSVILLGTLSTFAQKIEFERVEFEYIQMPLIPFPETVKSYRVQCQNLHAESVSSMREAYESEKEDAQAEVDNEHQAVKIINSIHGNSTKARFVEKPYFPMVYDGPMVTNKLVLEQYQKTEINPDVYVTLEMQGLNHSKTLKTSGSAEAKTYYYWVTAKHEMKLIVNDAQGELIGEYFVTGSDSTLGATTKKFKSSEALNEYWSKYKDDVLAPLDKKISEANFKRANNLLNHKHGSMQRKRTFKLAVVNDKKVDYSSYMTAYEAVIEGALYYIDDEEQAKAKFKEATDIWEAELKEADVKDKKARINEKVAAATRYNCVVLYTWARDYKMANLQYVKLKAMDLGKYNRQMKMLKAFMDDQKDRYEANN